MRAERHSEVLLLVGLRKGDYSVAGSVGELEGEVAESANNRRSRTRSSAKGREKEDEEEESERLPSDTLDRDDVSRESAHVSHGVVDGDTFKTNNEPSTSK